MVQADVHTSTGSSVVKAARVGPCVGVQGHSVLQLSVIGVTASVIGHWLSVSITSGFSQDLDKEIRAAAQKKADEEKKEEEERKEREEERKRRERERERDRERASEREKETKRESEREGKRPRVGEVSESSVNDAAPHHMQSKASESSGGDGSTATAASSRALDETTANAVSPSTGLLDLFKEKGFDEVLCKRMCDGLGAITLDDWSLVEDHDIDHIKEEWDLKLIQIKKLKMLVEECKKILEVKKSKAGGGGGSAATAELSGGREEKNLDKRKHGGGELLAPNDGKTRKTGPESTESGDDGEGLEDVTEDQTIWAHLEFEDGQIVPLKNSVSTSAQDPFVIGRDEKVVHHVARDECVNENGKGCRISGRHCNIRRLEDRRVVVQVLQKQSIME